MQETRFAPWVGKIPCGRAGQSTLVGLPGEPHGQFPWWAVAHAVQGLRQDPATDTVTIRQCLVLDTRNSSEIERDGSFLLIRRLAWNV